MRRCHHDDEGAEKNENLRLLTFDVLNSDYWILNNCFFTVIKSLTRADYAFVVSAKHPVNCLYASHFSLKFA